MERTKKKIDMDYEKKYKEALKDMRAIYPNLKGDAKLAVEHAFPELRESEDERMINELQGFLCSFGSDYFGNGEWQKFDDWLEKQKEQKPADDEAKAIAYREYERGRESGLRDGQKYVLDNAESYGLCKPAEWSKEDNIGWDEAFACVILAEKAAKNEEELQNAVTAEKWLKEIKFKYYVHPVKQEWSEEDEKKRRNLMSLLANMRGDRITEETYQKYYPWLKSLRSRPKPSDNWKPSDEQREAAPKTCLKGIFDFDDISQLELAADCYKEKKGRAYPVTVKQQHEVLMKLYDLIGIDREALDQDKDDETD